MTKTIQLKLPDDQYDLLCRIATADKRRLEDLCYLLFGEGIKYFYSDTCIAVKKNPEDYTKEEKKQLAKNEELEKTEGFDSLSYVEKQAQGFDHVCAYMGSFDEGDTFLDKLAEDVTNNAFKTHA